MYIHYYRLPYDILLFHIFKLNHVHCHYHTIIQIYIYCLSFLSCSCISFSVFRYISIFSNVRLNHVFSYFCSFIFTFSFLSFSFSFSFSFWFSFSFSVFSCLNRDSSCFFVLFVSSFFFSVLWTCIFINCSCFNTYVFLSVSIHSLKT